jgi:hypothetical protein
MSGAPIDRSRQHSCWRVKIISVVDVWVPFAAAVIGAIATLGGVWLTGRLTHGRERQARRAEAYIELTASMAVQFQAVNRRVFPSEDDVEGPFPTPDPAQKARAETMIGTYASETIRNDLYPKWQRCISEMVRISEDQSLSEEKRKLGRFRAYNASRAAAREIMTQMRREIS